MIAKADQPELQNDSPASATNDAKRFVHRFAHASLGGAGAPVPRSGWPETLPGHPLSEDPDSLEMRRLVQGDDGALGRLISSHKPNLYRRVWQLLKNGAETADVVEEAFIRVYQHRESFLPNSRFTTWLYAIALNRARSILRRRSRQPEFLPLPADETEEDPPFNEALIDSHPNPVESLETQEAALALHDALAALPAEIGETVVRFACDDEPQAQIAISLGCSLKTVEMRLYHGRKRLRSLLKQFSRRDRPSLSGFSNQRTTPGAAVVAQTPNTQ